MKTIRFTVPGEPKAKGRPRFRTFTTKQGKTIGSAYTPKTTASFENRVSLHYLEAVGSAAPVEGPVAMGMSVFLPIPASRPKYWKAEAAMEKVPVIKRPDLDNLVKSVLDALNNVLYKDDSQVFYASQAKFYSTIPRVEIVVHIFKDEMEVAQCQSTNAPFTPTPANAEYHGAQTILEFRTSSTS